VVSEIVALSVELLLQEAKATMVTAPVAIIFKFIVLDF
jgi:hypothetical protein